MQRHPDVRLQEQWRVINLLCPKWSLSDLTPGFNDITPLKRFIFYYHHSLDSGLIHFEAAANGRDTKVQDT